MPARFVAHTYVRLFILTLAAILGRSVPGSAQVTLSQWPAPLQLYPRDQNSQCTVSISGRASSAAVTAVSLVVLRNQQRYCYERVPVEPTTGRFGFKPVIRAELAEYSFLLFTHHAPANPAVDGLSVGDSVRVAVRDSIVCGDVFLIMGQSNAVGGSDPNPYRNEFCRSFGVNRPGTPYNPADTAWCLTNTGEGLNSLWGVELQRLIGQQHGIPTAVINGAAPSTTIGEHTTRTEGRPDNLATLHGRLLYRARKAGVADHVRAMIWRQGEAEAQGNPGAYEQWYPQLYNHWKLDYPNLRKVYHSQLNLLTDPVLGAGALRDYQRRSKQSFPDNQPIATVGLAAYNGVHFGNEGYRQFGQELFRLVARDFYGATDTSNIESPDIQRIFFRTPARDELVLEFNAGQVMRWPADTTLVNPANGNRSQLALPLFMYTDYPSGEASFIQSATEQGNRIILKLKKPMYAQTLTYLPSYYQDGPLGYFAGPFIRNRRGMRALTFFRVPIAAPLPVATDLQAVAVDTSHVRLSWNQPVDEVEEWLVERADSTGQFRQLARLPGSVLTYNDFRRLPGQATESLRLDALYQYRVRALSRRAEADYSPVVTASLRLVLALDESEGVARVYPNPASDEVRVDVPAGWAGATVRLTLTDMGGRVVWRRSEQVVGGEPLVRTSVKALPAGAYLLAVEHRQAVLRCRLVVGR